MRYIDFMKYIHTCVCVSIYICSQVLDHKERQKKFKQREGNVNLFSHNAYTDRYHDFLNKQRKTTQNLMILSYVIFSHVIEKRK